MKYQNNTSEGVVIPIKKAQVEDELSSIGWIKFHPGDIKEVPEQAHETAEKHGLTKVDSVEEVAEVETLAEDTEVEAEESKIGETKVETKKVRKKKVE